MSTTVRRSRVVSQANNLHQPQRPPAGRYAPRQAVMDLCAQNPSVVSGRPTSAEFVEKIVRELRIRFYQPTTIKTYRNAVVSLLRWHGGQPHRITREHIREYLLFMVVGGASSSHVANSLSAIRTCFDKLCHRSITLGLVVPRRPKRLPVVLSTKEVVRLLQAATSRRDKLLLGLMYATGMRVSEVVRVRMRDIDFDRRTITVWQGKGRTDRQVVLPKCFESLLQAMQEIADSDFVFPADNRNRHISARTAQRIMARSVKLAGIKKRATPHSLRHSFATHSFEQGQDIRRIQTLLGHVRLETTTIYVKVARPAEKADKSPLDQLYPQQHQHVSPRPSVGMLRFHFQQQPAHENRRVAKVTLSVRLKDRPVYFTGIRVEETRPGYVTLHIPPSEDWAESAKWLNRDQRQRFEDAEFYELLQRQITRRFCPPPKPKVPAD